MARDQLAAAARSFLTQILPAATGKQFDQLAHREVMLGSYQKYQGGAVSGLGRTVTPRYAIKVQPGAIPVTGGMPAFGEAPVPATAPTQPLLWLRFAGDVKTDDEPALRDLIGDLDTYTQKKMSLAGVEIHLGDEGSQPADSAKWAKTIVANRAQIPDDLRTLIDVPAGLREVAPNVTSLRIILEHFFTFDQGQYYPRWTGASREIPGDLTPVYLEKNLREFILQRDHLYVYMLVPKALFTTQNAEAHDYREAVIRFEATGDSLRPFLPVLVHSVYRKIQTEQAFHDFIFFESEDGEGLAIPPAARPKLAPPVVEFLSAVPDGAEDRAKFLAQSKSVIPGTPPMVNLQATVQGPLQAPEGVLAEAVGDAGRIYSILSPVEKILPLAEIPSVQYLTLLGDFYKDKMDLALPAVNYTAFQTKFPAAQQDGAGVLVGIIDSGIDGSHPAFNDASGKTRIVAIWDQLDGGINNPNCPAKKNSTKPAYSGFNVGREHTGAAVTAFSDTSRRGTALTSPASPPGATSPQRTPTVPRRGVSLPRPKSSRYAEAATSLTPLNTFSSKRTS